MARTKITAASCSRIPMRMMSVMCPSKERVHFELLITSSARRIHPCPLLINRERWSTSLAGGVSVAVAYSRSADSNVAQPAEQLMAARLFVVSTAAGRAEAVSVVLGLWLTRGNWGAELTSGAVFMEGRTSSRPCLRSSKQLGWSSNGQ